MNREDMERHRKAYELGLLEIYPEEGAGWDNVKLPTWELRTPGQRTDVVRNAQRAANNTGVPQKIRVWYGDEVEWEFVEVDYANRAAVLGRSIVTPGWAKR